MRFCYYIATMITILTINLYANFNSSILDPAMMTNYLPESKVNKNDPETISRNFQAQLIKKMFLQPAIGDQLSLFEDDEDSTVSFQTDYANELIMHHIAHDLAKKDLFKLNEILNRGLSEQ